MEHGTNEKIARDVALIDSSMNRSFYRKLMVLAGAGYTFDDLSLALIAFILPIISHPFHLTGLESGILGSSALIGYFFGATFWGLIGDRFGRKSSIQYTLIIYTIFTLISAFSINYFQLTAFRILAGFGMGGESAVIAPYFSEFIPKNARGRYIGYLTCFFSFGFIGAAVLGYFLVPVQSIAGIAGWRLATIIAALPVFYVIVLRYKLPESPRWLRIKGRDAEADEVLSRLHGGLNLPERIDGIESEEYVRSVYETLEISTTAEGKKINSFRRIWSPQFRRRTSMLWILWFTTGFAFYGFFTFAPTLLVSRGYSIITSLGISLLGYVMQAPGYYLAAIISEKIGRKALLSTYMLVGAAVAISLAYSSTYLEIVVFYALMSFFLNGLFGGVYIYTPEQYPTDFRTSGMGYASSFARIGSIMSPILFGVLLASIHFSGVFTMSFLVMLVGAASVLILGQETTSKDLEKTSAAVSN
ncbi:MAG: MFS transporter [Thermoplasmatales archaeon]